MLFQAILWDLDDDPNGNVQHCAAHDVTKDEVEEVFDNAADIDISRSSPWSLAIPTQAGT